MEFQLAGMVAFAVLAALLPALIAWRIAHVRGGSEPMAILLGFFLSWLGLALVYFFVGEDQRRASLDVAAETLADGAHAVKAAWERADAPADLETRLAKLDALRATGAISDDEHEEQRRRILAQI